jgi:hypothetical protein
MTSDGRRRHLELGVEGAPERVASAMGRIRSEIARRGITCHDTPPEVPAG